jgi:hypothetical protein
LFIKVHIDNEENPILNFLHEQVSVGDDPEFSTILQGFVPKIVDILGDKVPFSDVNVISGAQREVLVVDVDIPLDFPGPGDTGQLPADPRRRRHRCVAFMPEINIDGSTSEQVSSRNDV